MTYQRLWQWWHERSLDRRIRKFGWTATYIGDYGRRPTWSYTAGFDETLDQPELIVFDAPAEFANALCWAAFEGVKAGALELKDGVRLEEFSEDRIGPMWRDVHPSRVSGEGWFAFACSRRARRTGSVEGLRAIQCVLPDRSGKYPWEAGYDETLRPRQPALWLPFEEDEGGRFMLAAMGILPPSAVGDLLPASLR